jgi:flagellar assembly protein FliH
MSPDQNFATLSFPTLRTDRQDEMDARSRAVGHSAGYAAGLRAANDELAAHIARLDAEHAAEIRHGQARLDRAIELLAASAAALDARALPVLAEVQDVLAENALDLAEAIIGVELSTDSTSATAAVNRALAGVERGVVATVRLNPIDLALLDDDTIAATGVTFRADPALDRGDAIAELPVGFLDARISTAVARARAAVMGDTE